MSHPLKVKLLMKKIIQTNDAPKAVGTYSQAVQVGNLVFLSGQIGLHPETAELADGFEAQAHQVFKNLHAVCRAAGGSLEHIVKLGVFVTDLGNFEKLNEIMQQYVTEPFPARAAVEVSGLPKGALVEMDAVMSIDV